MPGWASTTKKIGSILPEQGSYSSGDAAGSAIFPSSTARQ